MDNSDNSTSRNSESTIFATIGLYINQCIDLT